MRLRLPQIALVAAAVLLFVIANRGAYETYFSDDDLDNIANTLLPGADMFWQGLITPVLDRYNFRPVGHFTYRVLAQQFGLEYKAYVAFIQALHLVNAGLLLWLLARMGFAWRASAAATMLFVFQPALFAAFWKPMYLFDLWCAFFVLLAFHAWLSGWLIPALLAFWCAYKAKEVCIFLPVALAIYSREWKRPAVLALVSLSFGVQALLANAARDDAYALRLTGAALWQSGVFYVVKSYGLPVWLAIAWRWVRDWRLVAGVAGFLLLLIPLLLLPGRLFAVYLYVPFLFAAIAIAAVFEKVPLRALVVLLVIFCAGSYVQLRRFRRAEIALGQSAKQFVDASCAALEGKPKWERAYYDGKPGDRELWGTIAAYRLCNGRNLTMQLDPWTPGVTGPVIRFDRSFDRKQAKVVVTESPRQWIEGAYGWEEWFRWTAPRARLRVDGPVTLLVRPVPTQLPVTVEARQNGRTLASQRLERTEIFTIDVPSAVADELELVTPEFRAPGDARPLGIPVVEVKRRAP